MAIAQSIATLAQIKADIREILNDKAGLDPGTHFPGYADFIDEHWPRPQRTPSKSDPVRLIDYDGTLLYSYTAAEFAALSELPAAPEHAGLTAQGWNWTLADAKAYVAKYGRLDIGQMYRTSDGATRLYIMLPRGRVAPVLNMYVTGTVTINWGAASVPTDTVTGAGELVSIGPKQYPPMSNYPYTITISGGKIRFAGDDMAHLLGMSGGYGDPVYLSRVIRAELGDNVDGFDGGAFAGCNAMQSIVIPPGLTDLGNAYAFYSTTSLRAIVVPPGVTSLPAYFAEGSGIEFISLPDGLTAIEEQAFMGCPLTSVSLPESVASIGSSICGKCNGITSVVIPSGLTRISTGALQDNASLPTITLPEGVTQIDSAAFHGCIGLWGVELPSSLTQIGSAAFQGCSGLAYVDIRKNVTKIEANAFAGCSGLAEVRCYAVVPPTLGSNAFQGLPSDAKIMVPKNSLDAYKTATNWAQYADRMVGSIITTG